MLKGSTLLRVKDIRNPDLSAVLMAAEQGGEVDVMANGKLFRVTLEYHENPIPKGSPFDQFDPIPVKMTSREIGELVAEMRGE